MWRFTVDKKFTLLAVLLLVVLIGTGVSTVSAYDAQNPMVFKCSMDGPEHHDESQLVMHIGQLVQERTQGRLVFKYFFGGSLLKKTQLVDGVAKGIADISIGPTSFLSGKIPDLGIFEVFGAYRLKDFVAMQTEVDPILDKIMRPSGVRNIITYNPGPALFPNKNKFLKSPADWKGQKMRMAGKWQSTLANTWGGSSVFMSPGDMYLAVQRGVIDGYMLPWHLFYVLNLWEVTPKITASDMSSNLGIVTLNLKKWDALTDEDKAIFNQVAEESRPWSDEKMNTSYQREREETLAKGVDLYDLTPEEKSAYLESCYALWPELRKVASPTGNEMLDILEKYRDK